HPLPTRRSAELTNGLVATDCNGSAPLRITQTPAAGTLVGLGVTTVTLHLIDAANNESTCTATFTVTDNTPPVITTCASNQSAFADGVCQAPVPDFTTNGLVATDCNGSAPLRITQTPAAGTLVGLGVTTVTLHVIDAANNESTCTATFSVADNTPPVITTYASNQSAFPDAVCQATVPDFTPNSLQATDGNRSAPLRITQTPAAGTLVGLGVTTVTLHVLDAANNESTCTATFSVANTPPTVNGPNDLIRSVGQSAALNGTVSGSGPFSYQWTKDGVNIAGKTDAIYTIPSVSVLDAGSYCLVARDGCTSVTNCA